MCPSIGLSVGRLVRYDRVESVKMLISGLVLFRFEGSLMGINVGLWTTDEFQRWLMNNLNIQVC